MPGAPGSPGTPGATRVVERETVKTTGNGQDDSASVTCNQGEVATGGGWAFGSGNVANFYTFGDYPIKAGGAPAGPGDTPVGWAVTVYNNSGQTANNWRVYVICASP